jgi:signal transduction histidine kinase
MDSANPVTGQQAHATLPAAHPPLPSAPDGAWRGTFAIPAAPAVRPPRVPHDRIWFRQAVLKWLRYPLSRDFGRQCGFEALGLLLAIPGFVFIAVGVTVGFGMSLSFAGMLLGLPLLMVTLAGARGLGAVHRGLTGRLLGLQVESPPRLRPQPGVLGRAQARLTDPVGWRACAYLLLKLPLAVIGLIIAGQLLVYGLPYLTFPIWWEILHVNHAVIGVPGWLMWWKPDPLLVARDVHSLAVSFAVIPVGLAAVLYCPWWLKGCNDVDGRLAARLLGPPLRHRVRELEQTRAHAVDDSAARLRRIERDLHDGAQAQMVAVAMKLGLAREKLGGTITGLPGADLERALELVDAAHRSAKEAITELRDLARGIHPPVLDQGLGTALTTLAARSGVPVELVIELPVRPSASIETIAYFCAAELLANVAKHSGARHATLEVVYVAGLLRVRVSDDGSGGARIEARGGLAGLAERVRTVDGRLQLSSPRRGPTVVTIELPSHA